MLQTVTDITRIVTVLSQLFLADFRYNVDSPQENSNYYIRYCLNCWHWKIILRYLHWHCTQYLLSNHVVRLDATEWTWPIAGRVVENVLSLSETCLWTVIKIWQWSLLHATEMKNETNVGEATVRGTGSQLMRIRGHQRRPLIYQLLVQLAFRLLENGQILVVFSGC